LPHQARERSCGWGRSRVEGSRLQTTSVSKDESEGCSAAAVEAK
jgi:hypothetical protein